MFEITLVVVVLAAVGLAAFLATILTPHLVAALGLGTLLLGLLLGVPTGFWYHVILYRCLQARIPLPRRWWVSPADLHSHLAEAERRPIRPWYRIGGVGFVLCVLGGLAAIAGVFMDR